MVIVKSQLGRADLNRLPWGKRLMCPGFNLIILICCAYFDFGATSSTWALGEQWDDIPWTQRCATVMCFTELVMKHERTRRG